MKTTNMQRRSQLNRIKKADRMKEAREKEEMVNSTMEFAIPICASELMKTRADTYKLFTITGVAVRSTPAGPSTIDFSLRVVATSLSKAVAWVEGSGEGKEGRFPGHNVIIKESHQNHEVDEVILL